MDLNVILDKDQQAQVFIIKFDDNENRINKDFCSRFNEILTLINDKIKSQDKQIKNSIIFTGNGKYFSNGLDLKSLKESRDPFKFLIEEYFPLLKKLIKLGIPTIAVINGHSYAGGMILALTADYRIVGSYGYWSMNELLIKAAIPATMMTVCKLKINNSNLLRDVMKAKKFTCQEIFNLGIADQQIVDNSVLLSQSIDFAKSIGITSEYIPIYEAIKSELYREVLTVEEIEDPFRFVMSKSKV
jgi:enoyl-CoA hydratase/carnithine racemase